MYLNFSIYAKIHFKEFQLINVNYFSMESIYTVPRFISVGLKYFTDRFLVFIM